MYIDYDTMRVHDQFCTDYEYKIISLPQTYVGIDEDQKVVISNEKDKLTKALNKATYIMNQIEDDGFDTDEVESINSSIDSMEDDSEYDTYSEDEVVDELSQMSPEDILEVKSLEKTNLIPSEEEDLTEFI